MRGASALNLVKCTIRAAPLPKEIWEFLQDNLALLRRMQQEHKSHESRAASSDEKTGSGDEEGEEEEEIDLQGQVIKRPTLKLDEFWPALQSVCAKVGGEWADLADKIWAFGPRRAGTCVLIDSRVDGAPNT